MAPKVKPKGRETASGASGAGPDVLSAVPLAKEKWRAYTKAMKPFGGASSGRKDSLALKRLEEGLKWAAGPDGAKLAADAQAGVLAAALCFGFVAADVFLIRRAASEVDHKATFARTEEVAELLLSAADGLAAAAAALAPSRSLWGAALAMHLLECADALPLSCRGRDPQARAIEAALAALPGGWDGACGAADVHVEPEKGFGGETGARRAQRAELAGVYLDVAEHLAGLYKRCKDLLRPLPEELRARLAREMKGIGEARAAAEALRGDKVVKEVKEQVRVGGPAARRGAARRGAGREACGRRRRSRRGREGAEAAAQELREGGREGAGGRRGLMEARVAWGRRRRAACAPRPRLDLHPAGQPRACPAPAPAERRPPLRPRH
jgi:hypothetical protein